MHNNDDVNFDLNPGDVGGALPGSYYVIPVEPYELRANDVGALSCSGLIGLSH